MIWTAQSGVDGGENKQKIKCVDFDGFAHKKNEEMKLPAASQASLKPPAIRNAFRPPFRWNSVERCYCWRHDIQLFRHTSHSSCVLICNDSRWNTCVLVRQLLRRHWRSWDRKRKLFNTYKTFDSSYSSSCCSPHLLRPVVKVSINPVHCTPSIFDFLEYFPGWLWPPFPWRHLSIKPLLEYSRKRNSLHRMGQSMKFWSREKSQKEKTGWNKGTKNVLLHWARDSLTEAISVVVNVVVMSSVKSPIYGITCIVSTRFLFAIDHQKKEKISDYESLW